MFWCQRWDFYPKVIIEKNSLVMSWILSSLTFYIHTSSKRKIIRFNLLYFFTTMFCLYLFLTWIQWSFLIQGKFSYQKKKKVIAKLSLCSLTTCSFSSSPAIYTTQTILILRSFFFPFLTVLFQQHNYDEESSVYCYCYLFNIHSWIETEKL